MQYFGPTPWGDEALWVEEAPKQAHCVQCKEAVLEGEYGVTMPQLLILPAGREVVTGVLHRECYLRQIYGSVGHQRRKCSCFGGIEEDPVDMTVREAARAAVEEAERHRRS
jgi:hypothetical protein